MSGPPPTFPTPNVTRSSAYPPPGSVYPPQTSSHGSYPPQQPAIYSTSQPHQPPLAHQTRDPYSANTHAPASTYSYSSSPSQPAHLPVSGAPQTIPIPSVPGGYGAFTNFSGAPPPPPMVQRVATMPTPGQGHNPHSVPYHNVPAPVIAQPSHSGMSGGTRPVTGDWSHHDQSYSHNEDLEQRLETAGNSSGHMLEKSPPAPPSAGRPPAVRPPPDLPCMYCGCMTRRNLYDSLGGFCKEKHRKDWFARQPDLPCRACGCMTARTVYDSLGGFCTEEHKEWFARQSQHR